MDDLPGDPRGPSGPEFDSTLRLSAELMDMRAPLYPDHLGPQQAHHIAFPPTEERAMEQQQHVAPPAEDIAQPTPQVAQQKEHEAQPVSDRGDGERSPVQRAEEQIGRREVVKLPPSTSQAGNQIDTNVIPSADTQKAPPAATEGHKAADVVSSASATKPPAISPKDRRASADIAPSANMPNVLPAATEGRKVAEDPSSSSTSKPPPASAEAAKGADPISPADTSKPPAATEAQEWKMVSRKKPKVEPQTYAAASMMSGAGLLGGQIDLASAPSNSNEAVLKKREWSTPRANIVGMCASCIYFHI